MRTARDLIRQSLLALGVVAAREQPTADQAQDAIVSLDQLLASWSVQQLLVWTSTRQEWPLTPGIWQYTLGPGGTFAGVRPPWIDSALIRDPTLPYEWSLGLYSDADWQALNFKGGYGAPLLQGVYYDRAAPLGTVSTYPMPSDGAKVLVLYVPAPLLSGALTLDTVLGMPPGYERALRACLALELAPDYGIEPSVLVVGQADAAVLAIQRPNVQVPRLRADGLGPSTWQQGAGGGWWEMLSGGV